MPHVNILHDVPGHESGWYSHGGMCPLAGQRTRNPTPMCGATCLGHTPPIYTEETFGGLVLGVMLPGTYHGFGDACPNPSPERAAVVWDYLKRGLTLLTLHNDPEGVFHDQATVDAPDDLQGMCRDLLFWKRVTREKEEAVRALREKNQQELIQQEARLQRARVLREIQERELAREAQRRRLASRPSPGSRVRVTLDPPGFVEAQRKIKPRHRTPSLVGTEGLCVSPGDSLDPYMFLSVPGPDKMPHTLRVHRSLVRVVFDDGTLGDDPSGVVSTIRPPPRR